LTVSSSLNASDVRVVWKFREDELPKMLLPSPDDWCPPTGYLGEKLENAVDALSDIVHRERTLRCGVHGHGPLSWRRFASPKS
jgi:hypothetical protein